MEVSGDQQMFGYPDSSKYLILCSAEEQNPSMFGESK